MRSILLCFAVLFLMPLVARAEEATEERTFRAGAYAIDVSPLQLPVIVNGGMRERTANKITDRLHARCLVLDDGTTKIVLAVVDNCMMPRDLLDRAKQMAQQATGIPVDRMLISATHTHSAPSVYACLGSDRDEAYSEFLPGQIAKGIHMAYQNLAPAKVGWAVGKDEKNVACRRWLMKPGVAPTNPFGGTSNDRAQMHPDINDPNAIRATGPVDPDVSVVSVHSADGKPLALLANYSLHYVGSPPVSADYFGVFCQRIAELIGADDQEQPFVAMLSNGTSGDTWLMDYTKPERREYDYVSVAHEVAQAAHEAYQRIEYRDWVPIRMQEKLLTLDVRMPSAEEVEKAKQFMATFAGRKPTDIPEVYARETVLLSQMPPTRELKLQAIGIGELGITAIPNEVFAITGLTIKEKSPFETTFTIELANGCEGYIPPPDQHPLGGYTTWRARTSCLEVEAEPKIVATVLELLENVQRQ